MGATSRISERCVCYGHDVVGSERSRRGAAGCQGREVPARYRKRGWVLARCQPRYEISAVLRERIPIRARSVDLDRGHGLGGERPCVIDPTLAGAVVYLL